MEDQSTLSRHVFALQKADKKIHRALININPRSERFRWTTNLSFPLPPAPHSGVGGVTENYVWSYTEGGKQILGSWPPWDNVPYPGPCSWYLYHPSSSFVTVCISPSPSLCLSFSSNMSYVGRREWRLVERSVNNSGFSASIAEANDDVRPPSGNLFCIFYVGIGARARALQADV